MFSIYGISGPLFQGTLENLSRMPPVLRRVPVRPPRRISGSIETEDSTESAGSATSGGTGEQAAINAYQSMLPENIERGPLYHANQIMQTQVITVNAEDDVAQAWRKLDEHKIHQAPVLDAGKLLVGIVSGRSLLTSLDIAHGEVRVATPRPVREVMITPVVAANPLTDIRQIARVMLELGVDGVPIVDDGGSLLGFISRTDILHAVVADPPLSMWR